MLSNDEEGERVIADYTKAAGEYAASREDWDAVTRRFRTLLAVTKARAGT
jgi:hypothetical protein